MASEITMPKLSDTMTEGQFAVWKKSVGDRIERGDIIAEVETDKAVMELEAFASGVLLTTMVKGGETVPVGTVLGLIGTAEELAATAGQPVPSPVKTDPASAEVAPQGSVPPTVAAPVVSHPLQQPERTSPLVRRLAREQGIDLSLVKGSGPEGRITQQDLASFARQSPETPEIPATSVSAPVAVAATGAGMSTNMRQAIAATVTLSWQTIPHFTATVEVDMDACREVVRELKEGPAPVSYNSLVLKACAGALRDFPLLRSSDPACPDDIHINFAVSLPDGLLMPVIRQCQQLSAAEIERETCRLAEKCRSGHLTAAEMAGGSFSVSNLGMYGVDEFTALIMPGQTAILAVAAVGERPKVRNGQLGVAATMRVTLSSDHRSVDGAYAASFLAELRSRLEKPVLLLL